MRGPVGVVIPAVNESARLPSPGITGAAVVETAVEVARQTADSSELSVVESGRG